MRRKLRAGVTHYAYHIAGIEKETVHDRSDYCVGCPYPRHGLFCHDDTDCLRKDMDQISNCSRRRKENSSGNIQHKITADR